MRRFLLFSGLIFFAASGIKAQSLGAAIGYNFGSFTAAQRNFDVLEYEYRNVMPDFKVSNMLTGASLGCRIGEENYFFEVLIANKKNTTKTYNYVGSDGITYDYKLKTRLRTLNLGGAFGTEFIKFGASLDLGLFNVFKKNGPSSSDPKWEKYYDDNVIFTGITFFVPVQFGPLEIRPYFQAAFLYDRFDVEYVSYTHPTNNMGVNISFVITND